MKCPKCGYISFDFNQTCPKCNKDISAEQQKLNIPPFKPTPHFLLGALLGETGEPGADLKIDLAPGARPAESPPDVVSLEDLEKLHPDDSELQLREEAPLEFTKSEELISIEDLAMPEAGTTEEPTQEQMPEEISFEELELPTSMPATEPRREEIFLDLDEITLEGTEPEAVTAAEPTYEQMSEEISFEEFELPTSMPATEPRREEFSLDLDEITLEGTEPEAVTAAEPAYEQMPEEISFEEFDSFPVSPPPVETVKETQDDELSIDLDDIDLDDTKDIKGMIPEESKERSDQEDILEIDLDALSLETDIQEKGDQKTKTEYEQLPEELSMDDLFDALEKPKETGEKTAEILPDLNAIVLDEEEPKPDEAETEQGGIEMEGLELDLDLDLEKPDEKSS
ncbi:MAG: hypothetical protein ABIG67_03700 [Pseudomonadota bacterium]